jgi:hypothetical protein
MIEIQTVDDLSNAIQSIVVKDYGDFKRKTMTYLNRYCENNKLSQDQMKHIDFLKWHIQFHPNQELNQTKLWTLQQLASLNH